MSANPTAQPQVSPTKEAFVTINTMNKIPADIHVVHNSFFERFFRAPPSNHNEQKPWPDTQVIGVEAENASDYHDSAFRLYEDAEKVFQQQPTRLFLHGFLLCENQIELWLFSRSGIYRSGLFFNRITNYNGIFARYSRMSEAQRGVNPAVHRDEDGSQYIYVKGSANKIEPYESEHPREYKLTLDKRPYWTPSNLSDKFPTSYGATDCHGTWFLVMFFEINLELFGAENPLFPPEHPTLGTSRAIDYQCLDAYPFELSCMVWS